MHTLPARIRHLASTMVATIVLRWLVARTVVCHMDLAWAADRHPHDEPLINRKRAAVTTAEERVVAHVKARQARDAAYAEAIARQRITRVARSRLVIGRA